MQMTDEELGELKQAYRVIGVPTSASAMAIKRAYRSMLRRWHPDLYPVGTVEQAEATAMSQMVNAAYAKIEIAPLRYFAIDGTRAEKKGPSVLEVTSATSADRIEYAVRFVCGAALGLCASFGMLIRVEQPAQPIAVFVGIVLGSGLAAAVFGNWLGDRVWHFMYRALRYRLFWD